MTVKESMKRELGSFRRAILPHARNNTTRKLTLLALLIVWVIIEIGAWYTQRAPPASLEGIRSIVIAIVFREHGLELARERSSGRGGD